MQPDQKDKLVNEITPETTHQSGMSDKAKADTTSTTGFRATTAL